MLFVFLLFSCIPEPKTYKVELTYQNGTIDTVTTVQADPPYLYSEGDFMIRDGNYNRPQRITGVRSFRILEK